MCRIRNRWTFGIRAAWTFAVFSTAAISAQAGILPPGGSIALSGSASPGIVLRDALIPFEIVDGGGTVRFAGVVQDRVIIQTGGTLAFHKRIRDTRVNTPDAVHFVSVTDYTGFTINVDYSPLSLGTRVPFSASRTGDGKEVTYDFRRDPIHETEESKFFFAESDAEHFIVTGSMTITTDTGFSTTITVATPIEDRTPPITDITSPAPFACVCDPVTIIGTANDPDGTFESYVLEYASNPSGPWTFIAGGTTPVINGVLGVWSTTGLSQGFYFVRVRASNLLGLTSSMTTVLFVDSQFDTLNVTTPAPGGIYGGIICFDGTISDRCFDQYAIEWRPINGGGFSPVDPGNPIYTTAVINNPVGQWDTIAAGVPDGDYEILITAIDICGHTEFQRIQLTVDNTAPVARIDSPVNCDDVDGIVQVIGAADDTHLSSWVLQYTGGDQNGWVTINSGNTPVNGGLLGEWDTTDLPACCYTLRLIVSDTAVVNCNGAIHHSSGFYVSVAVKSCPGDIDGDGVVSLTDLAILLSVFGTACP